MKLSLFTTVYPGVEAYLEEWYRSVRAQSDSDFRLWIALDAIPKEAAMEAMGGDPQATWVSAVPGDSPALVRQRALDRMVGSCEGIVFVDSDDLLHPSRVQAARESLRTSDLAACALRLVDGEGDELGLTLTVPVGTRPEALLPRYNVFGFSNSAYRTKLLRRCMPIPPSTVLVDWFLATRAWLGGATLAFDRESRMDYRQYDSNLTQVRPPFDARQVARDTRRVLHHLELVRESSLSGVVPERRAELDAMAADVEAFYRDVACRPATLETYAQGLNALDLAPLWWASVAHPALRSMWTR